MALNSFLCQNKQKVIWFLVNKNLPFEWIDFLFIKL